MTSFIPWWLCHELVWLFCSLLNLQVHTWGMSLQVLESLSRTWYLHSSIMGELSCLDGVLRISHHWFVCLLGLQFLCCQNPSSSDMDVPMRSLGGRTMPDGAVGIYQQLWWSCFCWLPLSGLLLNQCSPAEFHWSSLDGIGWCFCWTFYTSPLLTRLVAGQVIKGCYVGCRSL